MRQRPFVLDHLAEVTAVNPAAASRASDEMLGLGRGIKWLAKIFAARDMDHGHGLVVLAHVPSPPLDLLGLLLIHPCDFISGVAKRMQDFI
jgi:hypothetical protein